MRPSILFPHRLLRVQYVLRLVLAVAGMVAGHYVMEFIFAHLPPHPAPWERLILPKVNPIFWLAYIFFFVAIPRLRDTGLRWFFSPLLLIPLLGPVCLLCLMFIPSNYFTKTKVSIKGPLEELNGELVLMIPLNVGGAELAPLARGIGEIEGEFLKVVIQPWLARKLNIQAGSLVDVDNCEGRFRITGAAPTDEQK